MGDITSLELAIKEAIKEIGNEKIPQAELDFLFSQEDSGKTPDDLITTFGHVPPGIITHNWMGNLLCGLGSSALSKIFEEMTKSHFELYFDKIGQRHLDIGSGDCSTPLYISSQNPKIEMHMLDRYIGDEIPSLREKGGLGKTYFLSRFNGRTIPYKSKAFSSSSLFYVLHHVDNKGAIGILKEASRITNGHIIVLEEPYKRDYERQKLETMDYFTNGIMLPDGYNGNGFGYANFFSEDELKSVFSQIGLILENEITPKPWNWLFPRKLYILKTSNA